MSLPSGQQNQIRASLEESLLKGVVAQNSSGASTAGPDRRARGVVVDADREIDSRSQDSQISRMMQVGKKKEINTSTTPSWNIWPPPRSRPKKLRKVQ